MSEAVLVQCDGVLDNTPASASDAGEVIQLADGRAAVRVSDVAANILGAVATEGVYDFTCDTSITLSVGDLVLWDASANTAVAAGSAGAGDFRLGVATAAKASGQLVARVDLNATGLPRQQKSLAAGATLAASDLDSTIFCDTQSAGFTVVLPAAASCRGRRLTFIRTGSGTNALTIDGNASENVDGSATHAACDAARDTVTIECDGSNWFIVAARIA